MGGGCPRVAWGLQVAAAAAVLVVAGPPFVVAERRLAAARAVGCLLVLGPAGPQVAAGGRPAGPLGPCSCHGQPLGSGGGVGRRRWCVSSARGSLRLCWINLANCFARVKQRREFYNHSSLRVVVGVKSGRRVRERCGLLEEVSLGVSGALGLAACKTLAQASVRRSAGDNTPVIDIQIDRVCD